MALAYLPQEHIIPAFQHLRASSPNRRLEPLLNYMERIWCRDNARYPPETWSVYSLLVRTNNDKEGWHRMINGKAGPNRSFYLLWELLYNESCAVPLQCELVRDNKMIRNVRASTKQFQGQIQDLWTRYDNQDIDTSAFLTTVSKLIGVNRDFSDFDPDWVE